MWKRLNGDRIGWSSACTLIDRLLHHLALHATYRGAARGGRVDKRWDSYSGEMHDPHELVEIHRGIGSAAIAATLRSVLESEGINCIINSDLGAATASLGLSVGTFRVFVQGEDAPRALEVLRSVDGLPDDEDRDEEEEAGPMSLRQRAHYNRTRRNAPAPGPVIGGLALVLLLLGLADLWRGWGATWLLLGLSAFAFLVALRSRDG